MFSLSDWLQRITKWGTIAGGVFLIAGMLMLITNIIGRFAHFVIPGSYEMFELIMAVPVAFGIVYAALRKGHVVVHLIVSRFRKKTRLVAEIFACLLSFITWALIAYAGARLAIESGLEEVSETLSIPYMPFRLVWVFCLLLFCLTYLVDMVQAFRRLLEK